jgi:hypothetical protein
VCLSGSIEGLNWLMECEQGAKGGWEEELHDFYNVTNIIWDSRSM